MANVYTALVQKVLYISKRKWEPDIHHYRKADNFRACLKVTKGAALCHGTMLGNHPYPLKVILV